MFQLLRTSPLGRLARKVRWALPGATDSAALAGRVAIRSAPVVAEVGTAAGWVVRVENHSRRPWPRGGAVRLRHRWVARTGSDYGEPVETPLPATLLPGDWADVPVSVVGPAAVGDFSLAFELVEQGNAGPTDRVAMPVTFPRSTDIDYHRVYQTADLEANSWWVVGAYHSKDEYEKSAAARREMLVGCGLTPDSRVLDVGCGTGQMALALQNYLTDRGAYYGTDIGREGIEFARRTYTRPNFVFATGEMTRIPFPTSAGPFDLAIYFSVFTHTFLDETTLLLAETRRLLGPRGVVAADVITSELVERGAGHRGQMWVNREHFVRLAEAVGFRAEVVGTVRWAADAERIVFKLTRTG